MKFKCCITSLCLLFGGPWNVDFGHAEQIEVYDQVEDICHPTLEDLQKIQNYLLHTERPDLEKFIDKSFIPKTFKFIGSAPEEMPQYYWSAVNCSEEERENCIITYASFNERYPLGAKRLYETILKSNFKGHVHCRIGGWPDIEGGGLVLAHVPFAFKVCFIREMKRKGYKRVFWMDSSLLPFADLNEIFDLIASKGYLVQANSHTFHPPYMNPETAASLGYSFEEASSLLSCAAHFLGVDLTNSKASALIDAWFLAAKNPYSFYSARSDQTALSLLLHKEKMTDWLSAKSTGEFSCTTPQTLVLMDRAYVKN